MENFGGQITSTIFALLFVGVLAWVSLSLLKRVQQGRGIVGNGKTRLSAADLRFVRALPLGTKERVVVVHYRGDELLLGITAGGISLLARSAVPADEAAVPHNVTSANSPEGSRSGAT
jgi:flagellar protein FliO/FliZ